MEMGSSSLASSGACGSGDSLNGLKFGKKIYFEDLSGGGAAAAGSSSRAPAPSSEEPAAQGKKGKGVVHGGQQPPRCRVEGCKVDLTGAKAYYCRHKVCGMHSKAPKVIVAGLEQRFCQQCSRFHQLAEFDQGKRSCRRRLAGHNERRRKPPPGPLARYGQLPSSFHEEGNRFRSFLMDFTHPRMPVTARDVWPNVRAGDRMAANQWNRNADAPPGATAMHAAHPHPYIQGPISVSEHPPDPCLAGVTDSSCALSLLSTQPWGATASRNRAPTFSANSCFDGAPMAQQVVNSYGTNLWGFKGNGSSSGPRENPHEMGLGHVTDGRGGDCQFSGELELALQGSRQCPDHAPSRSYHGMHWPL